MVKLFSTTNSLNYAREKIARRKGKITIQKAKNWVNPEKNPNGLALNFKIVGGCKFIVTEEWHEAKD